MAWHRVHPDLKARLLERVIFNFRVDAQAIAARLPVPWLAPRLARGTALVSPCYRRLESTTLAALPLGIGHAGGHCAWRIGVWNERDGGTAGTASTRGCVAEPSMTWHRISR